MSTLLLVNPAAGRGAGRTLAGKVQTCLRELGIDFDTEFTRAPREAIEIVEHGTSTHDAILVAGGDGTWFEAVNGAMRAPQRPRLGLIPIGTGNDFAKMLGFGNDWREACQRIAAGHTRAVDIGRCNQDYFANGAGIGFDAQVSREARRIRYLRGNAVYLLAVMRTLLLRYATPEVTIEHDTGTLQQTITLVAAANGRCYGGAFRIAPDAEIDDGYLELVCARGLGRLHILRLLPKVLAGRHIGDPAITMLRTRRVTIRSTVPLPLHLDGEVIADEAMHLDIEILPQALNVFA
ncbi:MAG: diacylglycerol/lipid kinase family protein [Gammaproteobacteria bacterium]